MVQKWSIDEFKRTRSGPMVYYKGPESPKNCQIVNLKEPKAPKVVQYCSKKYQKVHKWSNSLPKRTKNPNIYKND